MPRCPTDDGIVAEEGDTCDLDCYARFFHVHRPVDGWIYLGDGEATPRPLHEQPWYLQELRDATVDSDRDLQL